PRGWPARPKPCQPPTSLRSARDGSPPVAPADQEAGGAKGGGPSGTLREPFYLQISFAVCNHALLRSLGRPPAGVCPGAQAGAPEARRKPPEAGLEAVPGPPSKDDSFG